MVLRFFLFSHQTEFTRYMFTISINKIKPKSRNTKENRVLNHLIFARKTIYLYHVSKGTQELGKLPNGHLQPGKIQKTAPILSSQVILI